MECAISVVVPVYNVELYLERCIESILDQSFQDFELILVDDGSKDRSGEICDRYQSQDERVRVIHQENAGAGLARNRGLEAAEGIYLMFSDSDDYLERDLLRNLYEAVTGAKADCAVAGCTMVYADGTTHPMPCVKERKLFPTEEEVGELLLGSVSSLPKFPLDSTYGQSACARMYRRQLLMEHNVRYISERECVSEDIIFNVDFLKYAKCAVAIPDVSYHYYCGHAGSLSKGYRSNRLEMDLKLQQVLEKQFAEIFSRDRYILYLQRLLIMSAAYDITQEVLYHDHVDKTHPMRGSVRKMLANQKLREALKEYPWLRLPFLRIILAGTMRFRMTDLLIFLIRIQQRIMKSCQNI